jgi:hypothetical protein
MGLYGEAVLKPRVTTHSAVCDWLADLCTHRCPVKDVDHSSNNQACGLPVGSRPLTRGHSPLTLTGAPWPVVDGQRQGTPLVPGVASAQDGARVTC